MSNPKAETVTPTHDPDPNPENRVPLHNLSLIHTRLDSLHHFLSQSINSNTLLSNHQFTAVSTDVVSAIHHLILNSAALISAASFVGKLPEAPVSKPLSFSQNFTSAGHVTDPPEAPVTNPWLEFPISEKVLDLKTEVHEDDEIVELDAMELLAEHTHFCEICGKGFRRDANLRMHMRAHGNQFKTPEALAKPLPIEDDGAISSTRRRRDVATRFSCPFEGCNRNKGHKKFKALKSMVCVKSHFKRSHCPKMYSCNRCHKKNFSLLSDLRSHMKQCGECTSKWKCSCGNTFSRKDKLFGHIALFEGHMPALTVDEEEKGKNVALAMAVEEEDEDPMLINDSELGDCFLDDDNWFFNDLDKLGSFTPLDFPPSNMRTEEFVVT